MAGEEIKLADLTARGQKLPSITFVMIGFVNDAQLLDCHRHAERLP